MKKFKSYSEFTPDYTPVEMVKLGIFGGNYFSQTHYSKGYDFEQKYIIDFHSDLLNEKIDIDNLLLSRYNKEKNLFKVFCGSSLAQWQDRNWIYKRDPYGWFEWYIKFYYGQRSDGPMDQKQIMRWISFKARHGGMLRSHVGYKEIDNLNLCLKTRQNLLHWAIDSTKI